MQKMLLGIIFSIFAVSLAIPHTVVADKQVDINMTASIIKKGTDGKLTGGWTPKKITVTEGDEVVIHLKSLDVEHVFLLPDYKIEKDVNPGAAVEVRFVADKAGIFYFQCGMECGPYHKNMLGQLIVEKKS